MNFKRMEELLEKKRAFIRGDGDAYSNEEARELMQALLLNDTLLELVKRANEIEDAAQRVLLSSSNRAVKALVEALES